MGVGWKGEIEEEINKREALWNIKLHFKRTHYVLAVVKIYRTPAVAHYTQKSHSMHSQNFVCMHS